MAVALTESIKDVVSRLNASTTALAALGAAMNARLHGVEPNPKIKPYIFDVVSLLGIGKQLEELTQLELRAQLGQIQVFAQTNSKLLNAYPQSIGWAHDEAKILEAAGDASIGFPTLLKDKIAPALEGLDEHLSQPNASFIDVGVGVGALAIEMARIWPKLSITGIEPWPPSIAMARARVAAEGLNDRIQLREQSGENLTDSEAYDLAWLPSVFISEPSLSSILRKIRVALRPGGWLLFPMTKPGPDQLATALAQLRTEMFGGFISTPDEAEALLRQQGFIGVRSFPSAVTSTTCLLVGRREQEI
jgi:2-polyprenyl-3-methyl-5-hydroxy-6-metoxy-1,4-benzoquinol methylase